jgi:hypothetical protein
MADGVPPVLWSLMAVLGVVVAVAGIRRQHREVAASVRRVAEPVPPWEIEAEAFNAAVVTYVWGLPRQDVPGDHPDDVRRWHGSHAEWLLAAIASYRETAAGLPGDAAAIARVLRVESPMLSRDAADSLAAWAVRSGPAEPAERAGGDDEDAAGP